VCHAVVCALTLPQNKILAHDKEAVQNVQKSVTLSCAMVKAARHVFVMCNAWQNDHSVLFIIIIFAYIKLHSNKNYKHHICITLSITRCSYMIMPITGHSHISSSITRSPHITLTVTSSSQTLVSHLGSFAVANSH
jgi:hypothetical protein